MYKRILKDLNAVKYGVPVASDNTVSREKSLFEPLLVEVDSTTHLTTLCSDIKLLFNQKRLKKTYGDVQVNNLIDSVNSSLSAPLRNPAGKFDDESLFSYIKPRHLQAPNEIQSWNDFLTRHRELTIEGIRKKYDAYVENRKAASKSSSQPVKKEE